MGINGVTCFLPKKAVPTSLGDLKVGKPVDCVVQDVDSVSRTVTLRAHKKAIIESIVHGNTLPVNGIHPGMLFNVFVDSVVEVGII